MVLRYQISLDQAQVIVVLIVKDGAHVRAAPEDVAAGMRIAERFNVVFLSVDRNDATGLLVIGRWLLVCRAHLYI
jgi:hypothetical protein